MKLKQMVLLLALNILMFESELQAKDLQLNDVLQAAFTRHPDLKISALQVKLREAEGGQIEGMLDTSFGASLGFNDEVSPATSSFSPSGTSVGFVAGQVTQPFSDGSLLTGSLNYNRAELAYPATVPVNFQSTPNPLFKHQIDLIYRFPLVKGSGNLSYSTQKEANKNDMKAASFRVMMLKEQLANQAIALYFQFVLNDLSLKLADDAVVRAEQLLAYQKNREKFGLIEKAERLQTAALLAMRQLQQVQAVASRNMAQASLNRFMFNDGDIQVVPSLDAIGITRGSVAELMKKAQNKRPVFKVLDAQYAAASARLAMAEANDDYQLDLVGQVGSRALDASAGSAFGQGFTLNDRYIGLSIEFSDVWNHSAGRAAIQQGLLILENIKYERLKTIENLKTELSNNRVLIADGAIVLKAAKQQVEAEKRKYQAEMARYREGRSTTAVVTQFEGDLRSAELRALIQQVSLDKTGYQQALTLGDLPLVFGE